MKLAKGTAVYAGGKKFVGEVPDELLPAKLKIEKKIEKKKEPK